MEIRIRIAEECDLSVLLDIYNREVLNSTATFDIYPKTLEKRRELFSVNNVENHPLIVAECAGELQVTSDVAYRSKSVENALI